MTSWDPQWFLGHRRESLRAELLDRNGKKIRDFEEVHGFRTTAAWLDDIRTGGTMTVQDNHDVDWLRSRVKLWYSFNGHEFPQGVYLPATPTGARTSGERYREVELYDRTLVLHRDHHPERVNVEQGESIMLAVIEEILGAGEVIPSLPNETPTARLAMTWDPGTTRLRIVHDLLKSAGYRNLSVTPDGSYEIVKAIPDSQATPVWSFRDDQYSGLYLDGFEDEQDLFSVPNRWIGWTRSDGDEPGLYTVVENHDPASPHSIENLGMVVSRVTEDVEASSQAVLDAIILGNLTEATNATRTIEIEHPWLPIRLEDVVDFHNTEHGIHVRAKVTHIDTNFNLPGVLSKTTMRVIEEVPA